MRVMRSPNSYERTAQVPFGDAGEFYYWNTKTDETTWEKPREDVPPFEEPGREPPPKASPDGTGRGGVGRWFAALVIILLCCAGLRIGFFSLYNGEASELSASHLSDGLSAAIRRLSFQSAAQPDVEEDTSAVQFPRLFARQETNQAAA